LESIRIKFLFAFILTIFISIFVFLFIYGQFYKLEPIFNLKGVFDNKVKNSIEVNDTVIFRIDNKLTSIQFSNILDFMSDLSTDNIIVDLDKSIYKDNFFEQSIINKINKDNKINGVIFINTNKKIFNKRSNYDKSKLLFLKSNLSFEMSDSFSNDSLENFLSINPNKIGVVTKEKTSKSIKDIIFKFNEKYLLSMPFLMFLSDIKLEPSSLFFKFSSYMNDSLMIKSNTFGTIVINEVDNISTNFDYLYYKEVVGLADTLISLNQSLKKYYPSIDQKSYKEKKKIFEETKHENIIDDEEKKNDYEIIRKQIEVLEGYIRVTNQLLSGKNFALVKSYNEQYLKNSLHSYNEIKNGTQMISVSIYFLILVSVLIFLIINFVVLRNTKLSYFITPIMFIILICISLVTHSTNIFIPVVSLCLSFVYSIISAVILYLFDNNIWKKKLLHIYHGGVSQVDVPKIVDLLRRGHWNFETKRNIGVFMLSDTSVYSDKRLTIDSIGIISEDLKKNEILIKKYHGIISEYSVTKFFAYFGIPKISDSFQKDSIIAAKDIVKNSRTIFGEKIFISLHYKEEWFKIIKTGETESYSIFGNVSTILSSLNNYGKLFNTEIIITEALYKVLKELTPVRLLDRVKIQDISGSVRLMQLLTDKDIEKGNDFFDYFHAGLKLFEKRNWEEASAYFRQCLKIDENDKPSQIYLQRCKDFLSSPPSEDWDGCFELDKFTKA